MNDTTSRDDHHVIVRLKVSRLRALTRSLLWVAAAAIGFSVTWIIYSGLSFQASGADSRIVDMGIALAGLPVVVVTLILTWHGLRYFLLSIWLGSLHIEATACQLVLQLGPFGLRRFEVENLTIQYPFELDNPEEVGFEAFLPEAQQLATMLPKMTYPHYGEPVNRTILRFCAGMEAEAAGRLKLAIVVWRPKYQAVMDEAEETVGQGIVGV